MAKEQQYTAEKLYGMIASEKIVEIITINIFNNSELMKLMIIWYMISIDENLSQTRQDTHIETSRGTEWQTLWPNCIVIGHQETLEWSLPLDPSIKDEVSSEEKSRLVKTENKRKLQRKNTNVILNTRVTSNPIASLLKGQDPRSSEISKTRDTHRDFQTRDKRGPKFFGPISRVAVSTPQRSISHDDETTRRGDEKVIHGGKGVQCYEITSSKADRRQMLPLAKHRGVVNCEYNYARSYISLRNAKCVTNSRNIREINTPD
ncbi:hypothetical protein WN51_01233 [Melipona quadrifasciata]|uniref:Uncharacterized protein n=1 Tax=Melipona quadrifasciata TaxID=166423 RepID=A0A0M8ZZW5_9HYME|nr:hypothetical protein WN51_01233 [Melipona quadrifasciata]